MKIRKQIFAVVFFVLMSMVLIFQSSFQTNISLAKAKSIPTQIVQPSASSSGNFSIIWITDTQYLSQLYPTYFDALCRWIVNNVNTYNVKMVIHTGDLVDTEGNQTQWANANNSMSILLNAGIPYCWNAGNHDYDATCWIGNQYTAFNASELATQPYWVDSFNEGQNTAVEFNAAGMNWLVVNLEFSAPESALTWANSLLDTRPDTHAIVAAHFYLNRTGGYESWATNLRNTVLDVHPSVFLTLSGHVYPLAHSGLRVQAGDRDELVFNRQDKDGELGAASLRILTFDVADGVLDVKTFVLYANSFLNDANNQFALDTTFHNDASQMLSPDVPEFPIAWLIVGSVLLTSVVLFCNNRKSLGHLRSAKCVAAEPSHV